MSEVKPDNASSASGNVGEHKISHADHHKALDEKYPTKRGFWDVVAKNGFLLLTHILCDMKCIGKENFPKNNPYVVLPTIRAILTAFSSSTICLRATSNGCAALQHQTWRQITGNWAVSSCVSAAA